MTRILTVIGTRPQFIKYAALAPALEAAFDAYTVDTGQHYDPEMSSMFVDELTVRPPDLTLDARRDGVAIQLADMIEGVHQVIQDTRPHLLLCMGDTNSTLAAALAGIKDEVPVAHVEAGERNFRKDGSRIPPWSAPEEVNRGMVDQASSLLLCASRRGWQTLVDEGRSDDAHFTGDLMWDLHNQVAIRMVSGSTVLQRLGLEPGEYYFATVHRAVNTDDPGRLGRIVDALEALDRPTAFPMHPRTRARIEQAGLLDRLVSAPDVRISEPLPYGDSVALSHQAARVITDSGGVTREAFFSGVPSVILEENTAWIDIVRSGWAELTGADPNLILAALDKPRPEGRPALFGDGNAAESIVEVLVARFGSGNAATSDR